MNAGGVNVVFRGDVGPYDAARDHSATSAAPADSGWPTTSSSSATPRSTIIDEYVAAQQVLRRGQAAVSGQTTGAIQPVVLTFAGDVPCVPLRLTAIAAPGRSCLVTLYVLGERAGRCPSNYFELTLNQAKIDWLNGGSNYATHGRRPPPTRRAATRSSPSTRAPRA